MADRNDAFIPDLDEGLKDVAEYYENGGSTDAPRHVEEITIKFAKGLVGEPFTSKSGKEFVQISIPNSDPKDSRPWQTFVLASKDVHENKFGKGMWAKIPAEGHTTVSRPVKKGVVEGKTQWGHESKVVTNTELKSMVEFYKSRDRESVRGQLKDAADSAKPPKPHPEKKAQDLGHEDMPFR